MIKRWQKVLNTVNRLMDLGILFIAYFASAFLWLIVIRKVPNNIALLMSHSVWFALGLALIIVLFYWLGGLYDSVRAKPFVYDVKRVIVINAIVALLAAALLFIFRLVDFSRGTIMVYYLLSCLLILCKRALVRNLLSLYRKRGYNQKHVVLIGSGPLAQKYLDTIHEHPGFGFTVDGYIGNAQAISAVPYLGSWDKIGNTRLAASDIDEVIVALDNNELPLLPQIIAVTEKYGAKVSIIPYFNDYIPASTSFETLGDCKLLNVRSTPLDFPVNAMTKRVLDFISALLFIVLTSPVMVFAAIGVKLSSPGPILFRQTRVGKNKKPFQMYKFRSMRVNEAQDSSWTKSSDARKTKFGSLIRKTSIDELPQLFNVLKGDMSLIGPRPEVPHFVEQFQETIPLYMLKHLVRPGITGWAQVNGFRGDTSIEGRIKHDIWYIEHWTLGLDFRIFLRTILGGIINQENIS